jgi:putative membrane protein
MPDHDARSRAEERTPGGDAPPGDGERRREEDEEKEAEESDLRTILANERTLLAWSRTALALLAASFAVVKLTGITPRTLRLALGAYLVALAIGVTAAGYAQWRTREARLRGPGSPSSGVTALVFTLAMYLLAAFVVAVIVVAP